MGKFGFAVQNEAGQRLTEFCQENALVLANTLFQQHKRRLYTWTSPDGQYQNQIDYILCSQRWRSSIWPAKMRPGADCGSDQEGIAKVRLKLKKVGKTTILFTYDLNQIPYNYTLEVRNRFKRLDLIESLKNMDRGSWHYIGGGRDQDHPQEKETQKGKMVVWGGLNVAEKRREAKTKEKRKDIHIWRQSSKE